MEKRYLPAEEKVVFSCEGRWKDLVFITGRRGREGKGREGKGREGAKLKPGRCTLSMTHEPGLSRVFSDKS